MSSPEDIFGSSDFADELVGMEARVFADYWREQADERTELFDAVRDQLSYIQSKFAVGDKTNWQSFHRIFGIEGTNNIWIAHKAGIGQTDGQTRIISCWDGNDELQYQEYVLSDSYERLGSKTGEAHRAPDANAWTREILGDCALIQYSSIDNEVRLFRGDANQIFHPNDCDRSYEETDKRFDINILMKSTLTNMSELLNGLSIATFEQGAEGQLY